MRTVKFTVITTDPNNPDTDGDGLTDGEEMGNVQPFLGGYAQNGERNYNIVSNPTRVDTDGDGIDDAEEVVELGSNANAKDSDGDGLFDGEELAIGTNLILWDTDGDTHPDGFEYYNPGGLYGYDPLLFTQVYDWQQVTFWITQGALCGSICEGGIDNMYKLFGNVLSGFVFWGDITEVIAGSRDQDWLQAGISLLALKSGLGDILGTSFKVVDFTITVANRLEAVIPATRGVIRFIEESGGRADEFVGFYAGIKNLNSVQTKIPPSAASRLAKNMSLDQLDEILNAGAEVRQGSQFFEDPLGWKQAEEFLRNGTPRPGKLDTSEGRRFLDAIDDSGLERIGKEAKTGFVRFDCELGRICKQFRKDLELLGNDNIQKLEWHFFASGRSNTLGFDPRWLDKFNEAGNKFKFVIHVPN